jgi:hypothetical protein
MNEYNNPVANEGLLYSFIVTLSTDALTHNKKKDRLCSTLNSNQAPQEPKSTALRVDLSVWLRTVSRR